MGMTPISVMMHKECSKLREGESFSDVVLHLTSKKEDLNRLGSHEEQGIS
jgi:predicted CopG family antitoxin